MLDKQGFVKKKYTEKFLSKYIVSHVVDQWTKINENFKPPVIISEKSVERKIFTLITRADDVIWGRAKKSVQETFNKGSLKNQFLTFFTIGIDPSPVYEININKNKLSLAEISSNMAQISFIE